MVRPALRLFDLLAGPLRAAGVDYPQFRAILEVKLMLDSRRAMIAFARRQGRESGKSNLDTLLFYAFMGLIISPLAFTAQSPLVGMTMTHAFIMTMVGMSLVADFSSVLLDTTDNLILQPRPVTGRTVLAARIAHILVYLGSLALSLSLGTLVAGTYRWGAIFAPVFLATLVFATSLVICFVNLFYVAAIRLTSGEKLRDLILYAQVLMTVGMMAGYQLLPRLINMQALSELRIDDRWWIYVFPPTWMAAPIDLVAGHHGRPQVILSLMACVLPLAGLHLVTSVLAPRFNEALATLDAGPGRRVAKASAAANRLSGLLCRTRTGRAAFELVWLLVSRDRQFKLRTYPSLAFVLVFPVFFLFASQHDFREAWASLSGTRRHLLVLYMSSAMLPSVLLQLRFSDNWAAAWFYGVLPIERPGEILAAATKVLMVRFVLPVFAVVSAGTLVIWGPSILADIVLAGCASLFMCAVEALWLGRTFPFSGASAATDASGRMARSMLLLFLPAALGGIHYLLSGIPRATLWAMPVFLGCAALLFRRYARTSWAVMEQ